MKVGIMSMQRIRNYGSFLQAYGLKGMIESLGHEVEFVDYTVGQPVIGSDGASDYKKESEVKKFARKVYYKLKMLDPAQRKYLRMRRLKNEQLDNFDQNILPLLGVTEERNYRPKLGALVIGSDEVFNCLQSNPDVGFSPELFGANNNADKLISYAASFGNTTVERLNNFGKTAEVAGYLNDFDAISVRDKNSVNIVKTLTGIDPYYHVDPVLISDFSKHKVKSFSKKDFIIIYAYSSRMKDEEKRIIKEFARKNNKKLVAIQGSHDFVDEFWPANPFEVLEYFSEADYIVTDTFHGTIFSIINNKPFATLVRPTEGNSYGNEEKLTDLLVRFGLESQIARSATDIPTVLKNKIDYTRVNAQRDAERTNTMNYLREQLGVANE